jgi:geranylgeranyl pyrophosphate synthase
MVGDEASAHALATFGRRAGVAFQITDDVLDYQMGTGKTAGNDLRERKVTLPLLVAFDHDAGLRDALRAGPPTDDEVGGLIARVRATGALDHALETARRLAAEAVGALASLPAGPGREALEVLGMHLAERAR